MLEQKKTNFGLGHEARDKGSGWGKSTAKSGRDFISTDSRITPRRCPRIRHATASSRPQFSEPARIRLTRLLFLATVSPATYWPPLQPVRCRLVILFLACWAVVDKLQLSWMVQYCLWKRRGSYKSTLAVPVMLSQSEFEPHRASPASVCCTSLSTSPSNSGRTSPDQKSVQSIRSDEGFFEESSVLPNQPVDLWQCEK